MNSGFDVEIHEIKDRIFAGATGAIPARAHQGFHYPRSKLTRTACRSHYAEFMKKYGHLTHGVQLNIYAIAEYDSLIDFGTYVAVLKDSGIEHLAVANPDEFGLYNVEGAILCGERHILVDKMRDYFTDALGDHVKYGVVPGIVDDPLWDVTIDATFCSHEGYGIDRYEACLTVLMEGPTERAVTIMDGGFGSIYPWSEEQNLCSLTSAKWTPLAVRWTYKDARYYLDNELFHEVVNERTESMIDQMAHFYPAIRDYRVVDHRLAIRAMPRSAADARLVDVVRVGERVIRIRAGKLDAVFHAERQVKRMIQEIEAGVPWVPLGD